MKRAVIAKGGL